jgi:hypothetical protein
MRIERVKRVVIALGFSAVMSIALVGCGSPGERDNAATEKTPVSSGAGATSIAPGSGDLFAVTDNSVATFTVREQLSSLPAPNDAVLKTNAISGSVRLDGDDFVVSIDLHKLQSDQSRRDRFVRDQLFPRQPIATVSFGGITSVPGGLASGDEVALMREGTVNVNGQDAVIPFAITARLDGDRLYVLGRADFTWQQFGMTAPRSQFFDVEDNVHVEVLVEARR